MTATVTEKTTARTGAALSVVPFSTAWGAGRLALLGDLPLELELPAGAAGRITRAEEGEPDIAAAAFWTGLLERYFDGETVEFPLDVGRFCVAHGFTGFQTDVYRALLGVPHGRVVSYRDLAVAAGRPLAWRAVGNAMALNPLPVVIPCHRVIRSDGRMGNYGDDPAWKERLLRHEGALADDGRALPGRAAGAATPASGAVRAPSGRIREARS